MSGVIWIWLRPRIIGVVIGVPSERIYGLIMRMIASETEPIYRISYGARVHVTLTEDCLCPGPVKNVVDEVEPQIEGLDVAGPFHHVVRVENGNRLGLYLS